VSTAATRRGGSNAARWSTVDDVRTHLARAWGWGDLLARAVSGEDWQPIRVPLRGPTARDLSEDFGAVQDWAAALSRAAAGTSAQGTGGRNGDGARSPRFRLEHRTVGGRLVGSNAVPVGAWFDTSEQVWSLLRVKSEVDNFVSLLGATRARNGLLGDWAQAHPLKVLAHRAIWRQVVETTLWLHTRLGTAAYLRQIDVPGVDTKFIEAHQSLLAELLDHLDPAVADQSRSAASHFARRYGFLGKPPLIRVRSLDGRPLFGAMTDAVVRVTELAETEFDCAGLLVVENEITFLALPLLPRVVAVFGAGFDVLRLGRVPWVADVPVTYWGDIDTHGFVILDRLRAMHPHVESVLMDLPTLTAHRSQWVREPKPSREILGRLTAEESEVYAALTRDTLGPAVRLEQERVRFALVERVLRSRLSGSATGPARASGSDTEPPTCRTRAPR